MLVAIVSDTHLPRGARRIPDACLARLRTADAIVHAGDFTAVEILDALEALGPPVHAVSGNGDGPELRARMPEELRVDLGAVRLGMVHDAGAAAGRLKRMQARFADCDAVVFGHSHIPLHEATPDGSFQIFNPGSPTDRRRQPQFTMGLARVSAGDIGFRLIQLE